MSPGVRKGRPWGRPATGPPDATVHGGDAALAAWVRDHPGGRVAFVPGTGSDLAASVGLQPGAPASEPTTELPMDVLALDDGRVAVNMIVVGVPPDRVRRVTRSRPMTLLLDGRSRTEQQVTTVVVATGQWWRGVDLVPRGHPGDGRAEVQAYRLRPGERAAMRRRLRHGAHLPHARIATATARAIVITSGRPLPVVVDGVAAGTGERLAIEVRPDAYRLLV